MTKVTSLKKKRQRVEALNYEDFYRRHVKDLQESGQSLKGWCPFHEDEGSKHKGFVMNPSSGMWHCYSSHCEGNKRWYTAQDFCKFKRISLEESPDYDPYSDEIRYGYQGGGVKVRNEGKTFWEGHEDSRNKAPYNIEAIELAKQESRTLWICEGEKDTLTMSQVGELAIGIPSASSWRVLEDVSLFGIPKVIIAMDNDKAGRIATHEIRQIFPLAEAIKWPSKYHEGYDVTDLYENLSRHLVRQRILKAGRAQRKITKEEA